MHYFIHKYTWYLYISTSDNIDIGVLNAYSRGVSVACQTKSVLVFVIVISFVSNNIANKSDNLHVNHFTEHEKIINLQTQIQHTNCLSVKRTYTFFNLFELTAYIISDVKPYTHSGVKTGKIKTVCYADDTVLAAVKEGS